MYTWFLLQIMKKKSIFCQCLVSPLAINYNCNCFNYITCNLLLAEENKFSNLYMYIYIKVYFKYKTKMTCAMH